MVRSSLIPASGWRRWSCALVAGIVVVGIAMQSAWSDDKATTTQSSGDKKPTATTKEAESKSSSGSADSSQVVKAPSTTRAKNKEQGREAPTRAAITKPGSAAAKARPVAITPEREAAVMTFVQLNHPELAELLTHLKSSQTREYEQAIRELFRASERLAATQDRDQQQYQLELAVWTAQSKIQLISARLKMNDSATLRDELKSLLEQQLSARIALLSFERAKITQRMEKIDQQIENLEASREEMIERQLEFLTRGNGKSDPGKPSGNKPSAGKAAVKESIKSPLKPSSDK